MSTPNPTLTWIREFGSGAGAADHAEDLAADAFGNVYITGNSRGKIGDDDHSGKHDAYLAKIGLHGNLDWIEQVGSTGNDFAHGVVTDSYGHIYICGHTDGEKAEGQKRGSIDSWIAKYAPDGTRIWLKQ
ncbi:MAG: SBBP repeat-containing protein, partial [Bacteroidota bacterium]